MEILRFIGSLFSSDKLNTQLIWDDSSKGRSHFHHNIWNSYDYLLVNILFFFSRLNNQHNWWEPIWPSNETLHLDNEQDIHMSSENYEGSGYGLDLDLLTMLYWLRVSYPRRSGLLGKSDNHSRPIYLKFVAKSQFCPFVGRRRVMEKCC